MDPPGKIYFTISYVAHRAGKCVTRANYLAQSNEDGKEEVTPPLPIVVSDGALALVAGSHTTSSVLANIIYLLLRYPRVHARLRQEIDTFYTREDDPTDPKHYAEMLYLDAVMYVSCIILEVVI